MLTIVMRALGLAAIVAAARAAWLHHQDNRSVILTDSVREAFAAGQAAERTRRAEEEATARAWTPSPPPNWLADVYRGHIGLTFGPEVDFLTDAAPDPYAGPADGPLVIQREGHPPELLDPEEPEGSGWIEWGDPGQGTRG